jgi:DNA processing protein
MGSTRIDPADLGYPAALAAIERPPALYLRGALPTAPGVTVVGTRAPSDAALIFARALAGDLSRAGLAIWSGGALGIDAAAHEAALEAGGPTVVVAGGGLGRPYPKEHVPLFDRVLAAGGALLARVPDLHPPTPPGFLLRNELLAALTVVTIVVEAGYKSGARSTAAAARRLGRPLCVVPHPPWEPRGAGCALELSRCARAIVDARDVLAVIAAAGAGLPRLPRLPPRRDPAPAPPSGGKRNAPARRSRADDQMDAGLDDGERAIFAAIGDAPTHIDELCERTALTPKVISASLLTLTLRAVVVEGPAGFFRRVSPPHS